MVFGENSVSIYCIIILSIFAVSTLLAFVYNKKDFYIEATTTFVKSIYLFAIIIFSTFFYFIFVSESEAMFFGCRKIYPLGSIIGVCLCFFVSRIKMLTKEEVNYSYKIPKILYAICYFVVTLIILFVVCIKVLPKGLSNANICLLCVLITFILMAIAIILATNKFKLDTEKTKTIVKHSMHVMVIISFVCLFTFLQFIFWGRAYSNNKDKQMIMHIGQMVDAYEEANNIEVEYVSFYYANGYELGYKNLITIGDVNVKSFDTSWSDCSSLNYYLNRTFKRVDGKGWVWSEKFNGHTWDSFSEEQVFIEANHLHICVF